MADGFGSWLSSVITQHDKQYGADFRIIRHGNYFCQLVQFTTYRTAEQPDQQIAAVVSDSTHHVEVVFDIEVHNRYERASQESLTSHLRSVFRIRSFRLHLLPPHPDSHYVEVPQVRLEILDWSVHSGDRNDPVFFENTVEIGRGPADKEVQAVLRKWWFGESNSAHTNNTSSPYERPEAEDPQLASGSRLSERLPTMASASPSRVSMKDFLEPYLQPKTNDGKSRVKAIPEFIFDFPSQAREELERIHVFGLDLNGVTILDADHTASQNRSPSPSTSKLPSPPPDLSHAENSRPTPSSKRLLEQRQSTSSVKGKGKAREDTPGSPSFPQPGQPLLTGTSGAPERSDDEEDEDEDIPIRPVGQVKRKRKDIFDPSSLSSPSIHYAKSSRTPHNRDEEEEEEQEEEEKQEDEEDEEDEGDEEEIDSDSLSDYSRQQRHKRRKIEIKLSPRQVEQAHIAASASLVVKQPASSASQPAVESQSHSHSFPESEHSREYLGLAAYAPKTGESNGQTSSPLKITDIVAQEVVAKPWVNSGDPVNNNHRDESPDFWQQAPNNEVEGPAATPAQIDQSATNTQHEPRVSPPSALSFLNPMKLIRSVTGFKKEQQSPLKHTGVDNRDTEVLRGSSISAVAEASFIITAHKDAAEDIKMEEAEPVAKENLENQSLVIGLDNPGNGSASFDDVPSAPPDSPPARHRPIEDIMRRSGEPRSAKRGKSFTPVVEHAAIRRRSVTPTPSLQGDQEGQNEHDVFGPDQITDAARNAFLANQIPVNGEPTPRETLSTDCQTGADEQDPEILGTRAPLQSEPLFARPSDVEEDRMSPATEQPEQDVSHIVARTPLPRKIRKLRGFRPDLSVPLELGVSEQWVLDAISLAQDYRAKAGSRR